MIFLKSLRSRVICSAAFLTLSFGSAGVCAQATATPVSPMIDSPSWDYTPSWMLDGFDGKEKIWWCSDRWGDFEPEPPGEGDVIRYSERYPNGSWSTPLTVLTPVNNGSGYNTWEGQCNCDPAVIRGAFPFNGSNYSYAMYYTASPTCDKDNKIGVAFSNDGINWVKHASPIISTIGTPYLGYGAGQAQVRNANGGSAVTLWHTDSPTEHVNRIYERTSLDGINFTLAPDPITNAGMAVANMAAVGLALSPTAPYHLYLIRGDDGPLKIYKIPYEQRFSGSWTYLGQIVPNSGNETHLLEPGWKNDSYGNLANTLPEAHAAFGCGTAAAPITWKLCESTVTISP